MKQKAFTLIELLAVIIVLGILIGIVVPSVINTLKASKQKAYTTTIESVKTAAESYLNLNVDNTLKAEFVNPGYANVTVIELIDKGFLPKGITNPLTGEPLSGIVRITKINDNKYDYEYID